MLKFFESSNSKDALLLLLLLALTFLCFSPVLQNDFTNWDDKYFILENPSVLSLDWPHIIDNFKTTVVNVYVPLTILSWAIEYHFFEFNPFVFHLNNLLLHLGVTALVFWLARCMGLKRLPAFLAALISYWKYIQTSSWRPYALTLLFGTLSMLSKPLALKPLDIGKLYLLLHSGSCRPSSLVLDNCLGPWIGQSSQKRPHNPWRIGHLRRHASLNIVLARVSD